MNTTRPIRSPVSAAFEGEEDVPSDTGGGGPLPHVTEDRIVFDFPSEGLRDDSLEDMIRNIKQAIEKDPRQPAAWNNLAIARFLEGEVNRAIAHSERVIRTIKEELLWLNEFTSFEEAKDAIGDWISEDYNRLYIHSALGYQSPEEYRDQWEQRYAQEAVLGGC